MWAASEQAAHQLAETRRRLTVHRAQWLYFNRNLRVYEGSRTYVLKPLQGFQWTRTQAIQDAAEIIAECLEPEPRAFRAYRALDTHSLKTAEEPHITGELVRLAKTLIESDEAEPWMEHMEVLDDPPQTLAGRYGKKRPRIDMEIV